MGLLKRLLQEKYGSGLLKRAVTLKNYEFESDPEAERKKKDSQISALKTSPIPKKG